LPYKTQSDFRARAFAQSFWFPAQRDQEVACLKSDLGLDFIPEQYRELSWAAQYLCNRAIEVSRCHLRAADWSRASPSRPLLCVLYRESRFPFEEARFAQWLAQMQEHYELTARESRSFPRLRQDERTLVATEFIDTYKFVPRDPSFKPVPAAPLSARPASGPSLAVGKGPAGGDRQ
jgi:hypothetical protein